MTDGPRNRRQAVRVAHVVETMGVGGLEKLIVDFVRLGDRSRFHPFVVTLAARGCLADELEAMDCRVFALEAPPQLAGRSLTVPRMARLFRRERAGVVHTHSEGPLLFATPAARLARVNRVIHTRHHGPDLGSSRPALRGMALASRWVDRIACVAAEGARRAEAEGIAPARIVTVWNGIDLDRFAYNGPNPRGPAVIVARLIPEKDHPNLLRAVAIATRQEPEFRLEVAGDGPCLGDVRELAHVLGIHESVRFLGKVDDVPALLARASLLVLSSWLEGISLTLLEGMARGLPVVATAVGGNPEVVVDGKTGLLVPARSPEALAEAMLALWRDPERGRRLGLAGRGRAEEAFDVRRTVATYENLYEHGCLRQERAAAPALADTAATAEVC